MGTKPYQRKKQQASINSAFTIKSLSQLATSIVVIILITLIFRNYQQTVQDLRNANISDLKKVLKGDYPHVFYCHRGNNDENPPPYFLNLHNEMRSKLGFAILNCSTELSNGKTIRERFKLKEMRPTIFVSSPWGPTVQASRNNIKDLVSFRNFVNDAIIAKGRTVTTTKDLNKYCYFNTSIPEDELQPCIILMKGNKFSSKHSLIEARIIKQYKSLKVISIDAKSYRLSFEPDLINNSKSSTSSSSSPDNFALKLYAVRGKRRYLNMIYPVEWDNIQSFIANSIRKGLDEYNEGVVNVIRPPSKSFKTRIPKVDKKNDDEEEDNTSSSSKSKTKQDRKNRRDELRNNKKAEHKIEMTPEELESERLRKEQETRERMDQEAKEFMAEANDDVEYDDNNYNDGNENEYDELHSSINSNNDEEEEVIEL